jgi:hypothetical protein
LHLAHEPKQERERERRVNHRAEENSTTWGRSWRRRRRRDLLERPAMAASARPGEKATSFAMACSLLSRFVRQNGPVAAELGLGIKGEPRYRRFRIYLVFFGGDWRKISGVCHLCIDSCGEFLFWGSLV